MTKQERRKFLKAALAAMATATAGCQKREATSPGALCYKMPPVEPPPEANERREELKQQLEKLAEEEPPKEREPLALCYTMW